MLILKLSNFKVSYKASIEFQLCPASASEGFYEELRPASIFEGFSEELCPASVFEGFSEELCPASDYEDFALSMYLESMAQIEEERLCSQTQISEVEKSPSPNCN